MTSDESLDDLMVDDSKLKFGYKKILLISMTRVKNISLRCIELLFKQIDFKYNLCLINGIKIILLKRIP